MPWTPEQFSSKHNHKLRGKAARGASEVANKELAKGASDATAIRIGNAVGDRVLSHEGGGAVSKHWIQGAVKKPGELHRDLGVPQGEKIPAAKLTAAEHSSNPKVRQRAHFAENVKHFADGGPIKTFPIPSKPAPSGGEDNSRAYAKGGPLDNVVGGYGGSDQKPTTLRGDLGTKPPPYKPFPDEAPQPRSMACGGMIKHASYATGGPVGNTKSGFKSNAGDFH